jgi:2,4-dienoyl-CoA reductase-like NADH-dependent reductase (Old Yellow Enzyme family)
MHEFKSSKKFMESFKALFNPIKIGNIILKNRITLAPMFLCFGKQDGTVSEKMIEFYARRAKAGVSLLVVEASAVAAKGTGSSRMIRVDNDACIPGLKKLAKAIKDGGGYAVLQIFHGGRYALTPVAPSPVETYLTHEMKIIPGELTKNEVNNRRL